MAELSILIPARNELFLKNTVDDLLKNIKGNTEIIVVLDGEWADPGIPDDPRITTIYNHESIGQRVATNQACRLSKAKYVMKVDAHCAFDEGFDVKLMTDMQDNWTMAPLMRNLHAFDWVCENGHRRYQGPSGLCKKCNKETKRDVLWKAKESPKSTSYRFDKTLHFQYFGEYKKVQDETGSHLVESMSLQGSCFMLTRQKYWELNICDEGFGSWGQQGTEVACKTWLSGGRVVVNKNTWYAHMFRTQGADFGFPYPLSGRQVSHARQYSQDLFLNNKWDKAIHPLSWLIEKFKPVPEWHDKEVINKSQKGIIFYTDNQLNLKIAHVVQRQLRKIGLPIVSASLKPMPHFGKNIYLPLKRGYETLFKQILMALEASSSDIIFFCEHDVLYHPSHFDFVPEDKNTFYYSQNWWKVDLTGRAVHWDADQVSGICVYRDTAIDFYRKRIELFNSGKFDRKFEPKSGEGSKVWMSKYPYIDIRHSGTLTKSKWSLDDFRNKDTAVNFQVSTIDKIPGWDFSRGLLHPISLA